MPSLRLNLAKVAFVSLLLASTLVAVAWGLTNLALGDAASENPLGVSWLWVAAWMAATVALLWSGWRLLGTKLNEDEISQPTLFGVSRVRWSEATRVELVDGSVLKLRGPQGVVTLYCFMYESPLPLVEYVLQQLKRHGRAAA